MSARNIVYNCYWTDILYKYKFCSIFLIEVYVSNLLILLESLLKDWFNFDAASILKDWWTIWQTWQVIKHSLRLCKNW